MGGASNGNRTNILKSIVVDNKNETKPMVQANILPKKPKAFRRLSWTPAHFSFADILHYAGVMPLPPYTSKTAEIADAERYQTIYAYCGFSSSTYCRHFTDAVFQQLHKGNSRWVCNAACGRRYIQTSEEWVDGTPPHACKSLLMLQPVVYNTFFNTAWINTLLYGYHFHAYSRKPVLDGR